MSREPEVVATIEVRSPLPLIPDDVTDLLAGITDSLQCELEASAIQGSNGHVTIDVEIVGEREQ